MDENNNTNEPVITEEQYNNLVNARETLCDYCENDACENCIVTLLLDQAYVEAVDAGIVEDC